jgi:hypothetical protein
LDVDKRFIRWYVDICDYTRQQGIKIAKEKVMADKDWRDDVLKDLDKEGYVAIESVGILTEKDIRTAMAAVKESEANRGEMKEWDHIRKLQREKAGRLFGGGSN